MSDQNLPPNVPPVGGPPVIPPAPTPPGTPPVPPAPAPTEPNADFTKAVEALAAALGKTGTPPTPGEPPVVVDQESLNNMNIEKIQNPVIKSMAQVMQTAGKGLDMDRIFKKALESGDAELLDLAYIKDKAGANAEQLVTIAKGIVQAVQADTEKSVGAIHALAGGEAQWNACVSAFNTNAPQELKQVISTMLNSGNNDQIQAAGKLLIQFAQGQGFVPNQQPIVQNGGAAVSGAQALSKAEFQAELQKLDTRSATYQQERDTLFNRRVLGKKMGK